MPGNNNESGSAIFIVMIGIVLFAALMFTFAKGARQGQSNLVNKTVAVNISDIINYTQQVSRAVDRVYQRAYSEVDISFDNSFVSGYANGNCTEDGCKIFNPSGGAISWKNFSGAPVKADVCCGYDADSFHITSQAKVIGLGDDANSDLIMMIPINGAKNCTEINKRLGNPSALFTLAGNHTFTKHVGAYTYFAAQDIEDEMDSVTTGCFAQTGAQADLHWFYHVLLER